MTAITWDQVGQRLYETGVDQGVLYIPNGAGVYDMGFGWNGLTSVTESPSGAESNPQFADNIKYLNLLSAEQFGGTIEAFTYPDEFAQCDGTAVAQPGVAVGQQARKTFGLCYRTRIGNDLEGPDYGYKLHLVYGAQASPSERAYSSISDSPEATPLSWDFTTTPAPIGTINSVAYKPASSLTIDSTKVDATALAALLDLLYGTVGSDPMLPTPAYILDLFDGTITNVTPGIPTYNNSTHTLTIPSTTGVLYYSNDELQTSGAHVITADAFVVARPAAGYRFTGGVDTDWFFDYS